LDLYINLLFVSKIKDRGYRVTFNSKKTRVTDDSDRVVLTA